MTRLRRPAKQCVLLMCAVLGGLVPACRGAPPGVVDDCEVELELPGGVDTDILFVIDNSASMREEQEKVVAELNGFVSALSSGPVAHDFQVGVITTGVSIHWRDGCDPETPTQVTHYPEESGRLQLGKDDDGKVVDGSSDKIVQGSDPELLSKFGHLIRQGTAGSGQEMGLEAMRLALTSPLVSTAVDADPPGNAGFLRPGARLLVILVSDEDDCSDPTETAVLMDGSCGGGPCATDADCQADYFCIPDRQGVRGCQRLTCESEEGRARLAPVQSYVDFLAGLDDGTGRDRPREVYLAVIGPVDPADLSNPMRCKAEGTEAVGAGVRYLEATRAMGANGMMESICRANYGETLQKIAGLVATPHVLTLDRGPVDGRLLQVLVTRAEGDTVVCRFGDGFSYEAPSEQASARVTMINQCRLQRGDRVKMLMYCAG